MIARVWHGVVPLTKSEAYGEYLSRSDRGVLDYQRSPGSRGATLLRHIEGDRVHFLLISFWDSYQSIEAYAGPDVERARYFAFDRECLIDPESNVIHYEVLAGPEMGSVERP